MEPDRPLEPVPPGGGFAFLLIAWFFVAASGLALVWRFALPHGPAGARVPVADGARVIVVEPQSLDLPLPPGAAASGRITRQETDRAATTVGVFECSQSPSQVTDFYRGQARGALPSTGADDNLLLLHPAHGVLDVIRLRGRSQGGTRIEWTREEERAPTAEPEPVPAP